MSKEQLKIWREMSHKLDQLIILSKFSNRKLIKEFQKTIRKDRVSARILDYADGSLSYSDLSKRVSEELEVAEITVKRKISDLREKGFLISRREGREVYYENSGLFE